MRLPLLFFRKEDCPQQGGGTGLTDLWGGRNAASPIKEDANARATEPRGHAGARREHLDRDVRPVGVDLSHSLRRRPAHHLRPRRLGGAHLLPSLSPSFILDLCFIRCMHLMGTDDIYRAARGYATGICRRCRDIGFVTPCVL